MAHASEAHVDVLDSENVARRESEVDEDDVEEAGRERSNKYS
jgi:hypothetical protein